MGSVIGYQEAHGPVATFETDVARKIKSLAADINPVQEGTGGPSPDNVRPITGWTGAKVTKCGKNLSYATRFNLTNYISNVVWMKKGIDYTVSFNSDTKPSSIYLRYTDVTSISGSAEQFKYNSTVWTFRPQNSGFYILQIYKEGNNGWNDYEFTDFQLELGSNATAYEPYVGSTYDITFPSEAGTVYGGMLDVVNGELVVKWVSITSATATSITSIGAVKRVTWNLTRIDKLADITLRSSSMSNVAGWLESYNSDTVHFYVDKTGTYLHTYVPVDYDVENIQSVIPLATPITYQLTPQEIQTIIGTNTIYADAGDTSVIYPKTITPIETVSNVNLMELRRNIIAAQGNDNLYDKWVWKQEKNDFVVRGNTAGFLEGIGNNVYLDQRANAVNNRCSIFVKRGKVPLVLYDSVEGGSSTPIKSYPIPIPSGANNVQFSSNIEDAEYGAVIVRLVNGTYEQIKNNVSWINPPKIWLITGKNHYLLPFIRRTDDANFINKLENVQLIFSHDGQWRWTLTGGDIVVNKRNARWKSAISKMCYNSDSDVNNYLAIAVKDGFCGYWRYDETKLNNQAPIPVPPTATKVTVTTTPALQARLMLVKALDDQTQEFVTDNGFKSTPVTMTFNADDNLELAVSLRVNSSASSFTTSTTPTEIIVQFE